VNGATVISPSGAIPFQTLMWDTFPCSSTRPDTINLDCRSCSRFSVTGFPVNAARLISRIYHTAAPANAAGTRSFRRPACKPVVADAAVLDDSVLDDSVLDDSVLDDSVLDAAVLDAAVLDAAVLDDSGIAVLDSGWLV